MFELFYIIESKTLKKLRILLKSLNALNITFITTERVLKINEKDQTDFLISKIGLTAIYGSQFVSNFDKVVLMILKF